MFNGYAQGHLMVETRFAKARYLYPLLWFSGTSDSYVFGWIVSYLPRELD